METLLVLGGIGLGLAAAVGAAMLRVARRRAEQEARASSRQEAHRQAAEVRRRTVLEAHAAANAELVRRHAEDEARFAAEESAQRVDATAADARLSPEQEAIASAERGASRADEESTPIAAEVDETLHRTEEGVRATAEQRAQPSDNLQIGTVAEAEETQRGTGGSPIRATGEAQRQMGGERGLTAEEEVQYRAEEGTEAAAEAEEAQGRTEEEGSVTIERESQSRTEAGLSAFDSSPQGIGINENQAPGASDAKTPTDGIPPKEEKLAAEDMAPALASDGELADPPTVDLSEEEAAPRVPRQYRATARTPAGARPPARARGDSETCDRAMPIEVRLLFEKAGFCRVSLLPRRTVGMPAELAVDGSGSPPELKALQDEWYQDVMLPDIGRLLREGIEWVGALPGGAAARLSLSGREIFVLARHGELNGFVSAPRLVLGEEHVVLCVRDRLLDVRAAIALTESPEPTELNSDSGVPGGWVGLRGVRPRKPVAPSPGGDIIDALRPLPDVEIALTGGIRIDRQTWLSPFPPTVELLGDISALDVVTIDGQNATRSPDGGYVAPGWDSAGEHTVWCTSASRRYSIRDGAEDWQPWDAYAWSLGEATASGTESRPPICGVLVRRPRIARSDSHPIVVAASNPILIGARLGEIEVCTPRGDVRAGLCVGFPWFEPIWAIPSDALHCDKRTARVLLIGPPMAVAQRDPQPGTHGGGRAARPAMARGSHAWCAAILAAGRKGLQVEPSQAEIADLWKSYKRCAKALLRGSQ